MYVRVSCAWYTSYLKCNIPWQCCQFTERDRTKSRRVGKNDNWDDDGFWRRSLEQRERTSTTLSSSRRANITTQLTTLMNFCAENRKTLRPISQDYHTWRWECRDCVVSSKYRPTPLIFLLLGFLRSLSSIRSTHTFHHASFISTVSKFGLLRPLRR